MKINHVEKNNRKQSLEIQTDEHLLSFPYSNLDPPPNRQKPIKELWIDPELGNEAISYILSNGDEGSVHLDQVLEYNRDPGYMTELLLYKMTIEAIRQVRNTSLSKREIIRRLHTSPAQYYRLLDPTNTSKSINKMINLLQVLGCRIDVVFKDHEEKREDVLLSV